MNRIRELNDELNDLEAEDDAEKGYIIRFKKPDYNTGQKYF